MTTIIISYSLLVITLIVLYVFYFKSANIELSFYRGLLIGATHTSFKNKNNTTNYLDICIFVFLISVIWNE